MNSPKIYAILTGDLVKALSFKEEREKIKRQLKKAFEDVRLFKKNK